MCSMVARPVVVVGAGISGTACGRALRAAGGGGRGLAREWTDTFAVLHPDGTPAGTARGPVRWAAPGGLRSLVEDLAAGLDVTSEREVEQVDAGAAWRAVDGEPAAAVVLAMPQPQAAD